MLNTPMEQVMAAPHVSASLDRATYAPGDPMTLTVTYGDPDTEVMTGEVRVRDSRGNEGTGPFTAVIDPLTLALSDSGSRTWSKVSDNGAVAVFRATA